MSKIFDLDNPVMRFMSTLFDLLVLNLVFIVCCLPVVTIGAALTAMYSITLKMVRNEEPYIIKGFFKAFKDNFKQATVIWILVLIVGIILGADFYIVTHLTSPMMSFIKPVLVILSVFVFCVVLYIFPVLARFVNTTKRVVINSALMCIAHLPWTLLLLAVLGAAVVISSLTSYTLYLAIFLSSLIGWSGIAYIQSIIFRKVFRRYEEPFEEKSEEASIEDSAKIKTK